MAEFLLVDQGSSLFESASGCVLHRDPRSGKVKFLPLGRWKGTLCQEDLPVNYVAISEHLDMIGVILMATHTQSRKANGDLLVDRVKNTMGPWRGGKFMPLSLRCHSEELFNLCVVMYYTKPELRKVHECSISRIYITKNVPKFCVRKD